MQLNEVFGRAGLYLLTRSSLFYLLLSTLLVSSFLFLLTI